MQLSFDFGLPDTPIIWWKCPVYISWLNAPPGSGAYFYGDCLTKKCKCYGIS